MEFLVDMTTHVPPRTSPAAVDDMRAREALRAHELAVTGHLLRLWRPPFTPGQWRTLGLFSAATADQLETELASMPLRVWRTDAVIPLAAHSNDPGNRTSASPSTEFLVTMTITVPQGVTSAVIEDREAGEAVRAGELAARGILRRLWKLPAETGEQRTLGLWAAPDEPVLTSTFRSLPLYDWMVVATTPLSAHPSDPLSAAA
ncbi:muconolactone Delta-isomerase family protein [Nocardia stercoris]|uniref:Muconolactone delta-isomerase n=1 Tax=Nocardia stercoris TaxID=2483361 RepID=A0A3M2KTH3_9NOCA|nr:muconolactone Delta-isomerase family protein [Nocardia stercoris]RMI28947.1 muconolactone delta-isomerase [Nocardia stercoris]